MTIAHTFGEAKVEKRPVRVVALGWNDLAVADALGADVVGAVKAFTPGQPNLPYIKNPLPEDRLGMETGAVSIEKVASYRPDLILATSMVSLDASFYGKLSQIAPTLAFERELYGSAMEVDALRIGRALGDEAGAQRLVDEARGLIDQVKKDLPGLAGKTYLFGQARGEVLPMVVGKDNQSTKFMNSLGLRIPANFADAETSSALAPGTAGLTYERVEELDTADALFMTFAGETDRATFEGNTLVRRLRVLSEGRYQPVTVDTAQGLQAPNVANVGWLLDQLRPTLRKIGA